VVAFSPNGRLLASGGGEWQTSGQEVILWDVLTGRSVKRFPDLVGGAGGVAFSPDGGRVIASASRTIQAFDVEGNGAALDFESRGDLILSSALSPDGRWAVSGGQAGRVSVWDTTTGREVRVLKGGLGFLNGVAFSRDGRRLAAVSSDSMGVWDFASGQCLVKFRGLAVVGVAFSPDGRLLATSHDDGRVLLWDGSPTNEPR
jgi:WD40 repeat protein